MQKFYGLALSVLVSLSAAAQPASNLMNDIQVPSRLKAAHQTKEKKASPVNKAEEASWGEWQMEGTGTFTLDDGMDLFLGLPEWSGSFEGINIYSRTNSEVPSAMQYKFEGVYNNADIIVDYDSNTGLCKVMPQPTNIDAFGMPLDVVDCGTVFALYGEEWQGMSPEEAQEIADMYGEYNYFIPELGRFYLYLGYITEGIDDLICLTDCTMQIDGVEDMSVSVEAETFYKDSANMKALVKFPSNVQECRYACFDGILTQSKIDAILDNAEGVITLSETASIDLDCSNGLGMYTVVAVTFSENGTPLEWDYAEYTYTPSSHDGWKSLGKGIYTSDMFESLMEISVPTYEVEVEQNVENPGLIRIVNPYGQIYPDSESDDIIKVDGFDIFVVFDTTDPAKVFFKPTNLGIDFGGGWWISVNDGYFSEEIEGKTASDSSFGNLENGVITFPKRTVLSTCKNISELGGENGNWYYGNSTGTMSLKLPETTGIDSDINSNSIYTEYFNMQGNRILSPEKGTLVIERCGGKVTKKIIR